MSCPLLNVLTPCSLINVDEETTLRYELALAYQGFGELEKALDLLRSIQEKTPNYRNLEDLIQALV